MPSLEHPLDRKVKILATMGPASSSEEKLRALLAAGVDAFRINFSHGSHEQHKTAIERVRRIEQELARPIAIIADLQGPKFRIGINGGINYKSEMLLEPSDDLHLSFAGDASLPNALSLPHAEIFAAIKAGHRLLFDDGRIMARVISCDANRITAKVEIGGILKNKKGVSLPDCHIPVAALTPKDRKDLVAALSWGVDWVALSFVQTEADLDQIRTIINGQAALMAKIEKPLALERIEQIAAASDGIMVARGDLGVEIPPESVPAAQKRIVSVARRAGIPVVVATQMLESMIEHSSPTRAEVSDVATAIYDGVDAVMLSAESATGRYPIEAVAMMDRIAAAVTEDPEYGARIHFMETATNPTTADALSSAAAKICNTIDARAIVCFTTSGSTANRISRERPSPPILVLTPTRKCARRLALLWGTHGVVTGQPASFENIVEMAARECSVAFGAQRGDQIVITAGVPFGQIGSTNIIHVTEIGDDPHAFR